MIHVIIHWFNVEYWSVSWPNIFAPSFWTLLAVLIADIRHRQRHDLLKSSHEDQMQALARQIKVLSDRLKSLTGGNIDERQ